MPTFAHVLPRHLASVAELVQRIAAVTRYRSAPGLWLTRANGAAEYERHRELSSLARERRRATAPGTIAVAAYREGALAVLHIEPTIGTAARFTSPLDSAGKPGEWSLTHPAPPLARVA